MAAVHKARTYLQSLVADVDFPGQLIFLLSWPKTCLSVHGPLTPSLSATLHVKCSGRTKTRSPRFRIRNNMNPWRNST